MNRKHRKLLGMLGRRSLADVRDASAIHAPQFLSTFRPRGAIAIRWAWTCMAGLSLVVPLAHSGLAGQDAQGGGGAEAIGLENASPDSPSGEPSTPSAADAPSPGATDPGSGGPEPGGPLNADEGGSAVVGRWLSELDDDRYVVREAAQQKLLSARTAALGGVAAAARSQASLESSWRALAILLQWSESNDAVLSRGALEQLAQLENFPLEASRAVERLADMRERQAIAALQKLGARIAADERYAALVGGDVQLHVIVGPEWQGGLEGLQHIGHLRRATVVSLRSAPLGDEAALAIAQLVRQSRISRVELYGLPLSEKTVAQIKGDLAEVQLDIHLGNARLGVKGIPNAARAVVQEVLPGTAAAKAGLQTNDVITHVGNEPVNDFSHLTQLIGVHKGGDAVELTVERGPEKKTFKTIATFDRWGVDDPNPVSGAVPIVGGGRGVRNMQRLGPGIQLQIPVGPGAPQLPAAAPPVPQQAAPPEIKRPDVPQPAVPQQIAPPESPNP